jgi:outer membrane protein OmpA-like peptidoglycan-associated protein
MKIKILACALLLVWLPAAAAERPEVIALNQRLAALQSDPQLAEFAAYEKLQAQQAVAVLAKARGKQRDSALYLADRRVEIAETMARAEASRREGDRLDRTRSELLVEASRRDAARARQEAERLRVQAQIQAEEAERLRLAAEAETLARQDAEDMLTSVAGQQTARLSAARQKEAQLARQEAELMSGAKLPASKFEDRGEVFTLAGSAFNAGQAKLSSAGSASVSALAAYLQANPKARARIEGFGDKQTPGQRRADAVRDALVAAGIPKARIQAAAKGEGSKARAVDIVIAQ